METAAPNNQSKPQEQAESFSEEAHGFFALLVNVLGGRRFQRGLLYDRLQISVEPKDLEDICRLLKEDSRTNFKILLCIAAVDYVDYIQMVYVLLSPEHERTLGVKIDLSYEDLTVSSLSGIWRAADWYEREADDLFGVDFKGHPDLSPLLLYEGFEGFPGRKEFPFHEYDEY
ncbi:uncharacterized protein METZ01_LOCUS489845 [marine metagenome]|uniref:NADH:ubiquinone oxidoreductase 30kDa subunit domain-containing protein n=1 Tax=marine metagenome TaxID=408172 RepID=A0A383CXU5_9ZZZZ